MDITTAQIVFFGAIICIMLCINIFEESGVFRIALPVRFNETPLPRSPGFFAATRQGLARFEVNTAAKTLNAQAVVVGLSFTEENSAAAFGQYDLAQERSVQIGAGVYYFSGGKLLASRW
jgi:hypothetical protein